MNAHERAERLLEEMDDSADESGGYDNLSSEMIIPLLEAAIRAAENEALERAATVLEGPPLDPRIACHYESAARIVRSLRAGEKEQNNSMDHEG